MMAALADLGERFAITAIVPTSYGSTAALIGADELVLPILDYETDLPAGVAAAYAETAPWFEECCCPIAPAGLTLGRQLFWQSRGFADEFARARWILPFAQYWAWGLSGVLACEVTSLGAQTQLWNPRQPTLEPGQAPGLARAVSAAAPCLGGARPRCSRGRRQDRPAHRDAGPVGIHASSANFARYRRRRLEVRPISTGSWLIAVNPACRSMRSIRCATWSRAPICSAGRWPVRRFGWPRACRDRLAGRGAGGGEPDPAEVEARSARGAGAAVVHAQRRAVARHRRQGPDRGPKPGWRASGRRSPALHRLAGERRLDLPAGPHPVSMAAPPTTLCSRRCSRAQAPSTASPLDRARRHAPGAALLAGWAERSGPVPLALRPVEPAAIAGLASYAADWRAAADAIARD